jgi:putative membrane protein
MLLESHWNKDAQQTRNYDKNSELAEKLQGAPIVMIIFWMLILISMPFIERAWGQKAFIQSVNLSVLVQSAIVLFLLIRSWGIYRALAVAGEIIILTWLIELIGSKTGYPFGDYHYTDSLKPQLLGVPLLIPVAWLMMLPPAWAVAQPLGRSSRLGFITISALAFTAWDLFLDPQMVRWGLWVWEKPGRYFGIPLINFAGWWLSSAIITIVIRPKRLPERPLMLIYSLTCIMETIGLIVFWELKGPALVGLAVMGTLIILAYYFRIREKK